MSNLVYETREMLQRHIDAFDDPNNEQWNWADVHNKWERHAYNTFRDLLASEALVRELTEALTEALNCRYVRDCEGCTARFKAAIQKAEGK